MAICDGTMAADVFITMDLQIDLEALLTEGDEQVRDGFDW